MKRCLAEKLLVTCLELSGNYFSFFYRDGKMPVTFIQKYLVKKLELTSEAEVSMFLLPSNKLELSAAKKKKNNLEIVKVL